MGEEKEGKEDTKMNMKDGMGKCMEAMKGKMKGAKWFMLIPGLILISVFLLTFFLSPEAVQTLWLIITGTFFGLGLLFMLMIILWIRKMKKQMIRR
jgi:tellurite resistance protein TehA-like permease